MPDIASPNAPDYLFFGPEQHDASFLDTLPNPNLHAEPKKDVDSIPNTIPTFTDLADNKYAQLPFPSNRRASRSINPELKRPLTPLRQDSESRDRLRPYQTCAAERRLAQASHKRAHSATRRASSPKAPVHRASAPEIGTVAGNFPRDVLQTQGAPPQTWDSTTPHGKPPIPHATLPDMASPLISPRSSLDDERLSRYSESCSDELNNPAFWQELESRWILNLSMTFRDNSEREKFFITYADKPNLWRRVTISIDYRKKPPDSLEADLKTLTFQRDKSAHIYEAIRDALANVQFYETVTNLKLETSGGRLHVHVMEDKNEIIKYPPLSAISHLDLGGLPKVLESDLNFQSHLSGFVYRVSVHGQSFIKKEIPGPDMIDEFLYEVNALWNLRGSKHVIDFCAIVLDEKQECIKGLLISFAERGTLVDIIYDHRDPPLPWAIRDRWAKQIVAGLSDIHEHGFVQGDFTLSNIVIDSEDNVRIIDINRRGCPMGWEPPEFEGLIDSGQRISMYIGSKSDLYQLGMVLWALAVLDDEPERALGKLDPEGMGSGVPEYLIKWVKSCLSQTPKDRLSAKDLLYNPAELDKIQIRQPVSPLDIDDTTAESFQRANMNWQASGPNREIDEQESIALSGATLANTGQGYQAPDKGPAGSQRQDSVKHQYFHPPSHQDSGLGGMEMGPPPAPSTHPNAAVSALQSHPRPPTHQDSGLGEDLLENMGIPNYRPTHLGCNGPSDLAGSGAQFG